MAERIAVIGAGIAGAGIASALAARCEVVLLEREAQPGYHTTGRSAALFTENYGPSPIRALTRASRPLFDGNGSRSHPGILSHRGVLFVALAGDREAVIGLEALLAGAYGLAPLTREAALAMVPALHPERLAGAAYEHGARDMDVHTLHQQFLKRAAASGAALRCSAEVVSIERGSGAIGIRLADGTRLEADRVVNAAGAWADAVAELAGLPPIGITPKRRTAVLVEPDSGDGRPWDVARWPMVASAAENFYFKPDAGLILASPADATPSPPCDAQAEEIDVAIAVDRLQQAARIAVRRPRRSWAGLRSFAPDGVPVFGPDPLDPRFVWCAGQGGYGIQTAPAAAVLCAALTLGEPVEEGLRSHGVDATDFLPGRLRDPRGA